MNHTNLFSMENILPTDDKMQAMSNEELIHLLLHKSAIIRAKAIPTLASRMNIEQSLKTHIFEAAQEAGNQTSVFFGFVKVSWIAVISVLQYGTQEDKEQIKRIVEQWTESEKRSIINYLKDYEGFSSMF
jgi:hypothetical protein